ncbi:MAG: HAD family phosphatase [Proteobacteria bacterium]|nr:HAD family phosphatase [Pseudomonadota bacterium]
MAIRGFLFDLDGTLIDSERESAEAMVRVFARGHAITLEQYDRDYVVGRSWVAIYDSLKARYPQLTWTFAEVVERTAAMREEVFAERGLTVLPGARELLARTRGVPRALVTGSGRVEAAQALRYLGEHAVFDHVFAAEDVSRSKPAPDGYLAACQALGLPPEDCVVIEDSVAGIASGLAAGCRVVAVRAGNWGGWDQSAAHHILDTLDELTPALVELLSPDYSPRA